MKAIVPSKMQGLPPQRLRKICSDLHTSDGWDVMEFAMAGGKGQVNVFQDKEAGCGTVDETLFSNPDANKDLCGGTVTVCGKCVWSAEINYYLYGLASRTCYELLPWYQGTSYSLASSLAWVVAYRQYYGIFDLRYAEFLPSPPEMAGDEQVPGYPFILPYGRDIGPGVFGRRHWTILGWELRSPCALTRSTKRCTPCSAVFEGSLSIKVGNPATGDGYRLSVVISEWMASAYALPKPLP